MAPKFPRVKPVQKKARWEEEDPWRESSSLRHQRGSGPRPHHQTRPPQVRIRSSDCAWAGSTRTSPLWRCRPMPVKLDAPRSSKALDDDTNYRPWDVAMLCVGDMHHGTLRAGFFTTALAMTRDVSLDIRYGTIRAARDSSFVLLGDNRGRRWPCLSAP
ncbi:hypothetical protein VUR80DRAFT_8778 [Thermomyces stellatus]